MGHIVNHPRTYRLLQQRLDRNVTGAPDSPAFLHILRLLFSPDEADLATQSPPPSSPSAAWHAARHAPGGAGRPVDAAWPSVDWSSTWSTTATLCHPSARGDRLLRVHLYAHARELPEQELAKLFEQYFFEHEDFARAVFAGQTQIGRSLVREEALPQGDHTEVLDWERAAPSSRRPAPMPSRSAPAATTPQHLDRPCDHPQRTCLCLNLGAEVLVRHGIAEPITSARPWVSLRVQRGRPGPDRRQRPAQRQLHLQLLRLLLRHDERHPPLRHPQRHRHLELPRRSTRRAAGAAAAARRSARSTRSDQPGEKNGRKRKWAVRDADLCLGCGVCYAAAGTAP